MLPIVTLAVAALLTASATEGSVRITGTKLGLGMTEQQITELDLLKDLRPVGPASQGGRGKFFGVPCDATLWFKDGRLERVHFEARQVSAHSVDYVEDQLLRAKMWRECQRLEAGEHICDWIGDTRVHLEIRGDMLDARVDRPIRPWETELAAENAAPPGSDAPAEKASTAPAATPPESAASTTSPAASPPASPPPSLTAPTQATAVATPATSKPEPVASTPAPAMSTPKPAASAPAPAASTSPPVVSTPALRNTVEPKMRTLPADSAAAPAASPVAPAVSTPAPKHAVEPRTRRSRADSAAVKSSTLERATPKPSSEVSAPPRTVAAAAPAADVDRAVSVATWPETLRISLPERNPESEWPRMLAVPPLDYPEAARHAGVQGVVWVMTLVDTNGVVRSARIDRGGIPGLNEAALAWVNQARFAPCVRDQNPCRFWVRVAARFTIN